jgi:hypothetical protein
MVKLKYYLKTEENNMESPLNIDNASYEKSNRKMRSEYKSETGKTLGSRQTSGTGKRRISFACRFAGMAGAMKDAKGKPTRKAIKAIALKKWGFGSVEAARSFCQSNKEKK